MERNNTLTSVKDNSRVAKMYGVLTALYCTLMTAMPVFADGADTETIITKVSEGASSIWTILVGIVGPIAGIALAVCAVKILWGGQKAAEEAKSTAVRIVIGVAIVLLAPTLIHAVKSWFPQSSWNDLMG